MYVYVYVYACVCVMRVCCRSAFGCALNTGKGSWGKPAGDGETEREREREKKREKAI